MAVLDPVKVVIENFPEEVTEFYDGPNHPANLDMGSRQVPLTKEIFIERDDFMEDPPKSSSDWARAERLGFATPATSLVPDSQRTKLETSQKSGPLSILNRGAAPPMMDAKSKEPSTGYRRTKTCPSKSEPTSSYFSSPILTMWRMANPS